MSQVVSKLTREEAMTLFKKKITEFYKGVGVPVKMTRVTDEMVEQLFNDLVEIDDEIWAGIVDFKGEETKEE
jgi:hypothetical protein